MNPNQLTIESVQEILLREKYVCDRALATVVYLSLVMGKPLLLEGEKHSAHTADARRVPVSDAAQLTLAKRGYKG